MFSLPTADWYIFFSKEHICSSLKHMHLENKNWNYVYETCEITYEKLRQGTQLLERNECYFSFYLKMSVRVILCTSGQASCTNISKDTLKQMCLHHYKDRGVREPNDGTGCVKRVKPFAGPWFPTPQQTAEIGAAELRHTALQNQFQVWPLPLLEREGYIRSLTPAKNVHFPSKNATYLSKPYENATRWQVVVIKLLQVLLLCKKH